MKAKGKQFYIHSQSWYAKYVSLNSSQQVPVVDDVMFGDYQAEMKMQWLQLDKPTAQLCAFEDSWGLFEREPKLFEALTKVSNPTVKQFCSILKRHGFKDATTRNDPYAPEVSNA